ncbi:uncharacterized protein LOC134184594 [Corticium candelabrum]|uniref:uncharacterized protein LOC134184594 n=1 Tax=Corticium candelabrum TaxID=121492 RepID=UPI002E35D8E3|nr:uncharacterized protein LOC134184594 [Corticium candelabrum]
MEPRKSASVRIVLRIFGLVAGAVVIGCIAGKLLETHSGYNPFSRDRITVKVCYFHLLDLLDNGPFGDLKKIACEFGLACGAAAVLLAVVFCTLDYMTDIKESAASIRRPIIIVGSCLAVIMAVVWVSCFGYLTKLWFDVHGNDWTNEYKIPGQATLSFSFLSFIAWILVAVFGIIGLQSSSDNVPRQVKG